MTFPVRPPISLLTDNDVRELISPELISMCAEDGPSRVAIDIGCEEKTVRRARDKETSLKASTTFNMLARKGVALDPILAHFGRRSIPVDDVSVDLHRLPCDVAACLPMLIDVLRDGDCSEADTRKLDEAGVIDCLATAADMLRGKREALKLKAMRS